MPGFDRTGPVGKGSMTGRGMGMCNENAGTARGFGRMFSGCGRGIRGRGGFRFMQNSNTFNDEQTIDSLKKQKELLEQRITAMEKGTQSNE